MPARPSGTITFLFTDIEGSTRRWQEHPEAMAAAVERHDDLLRAAIADHGGHVFKTIGDAFCAVFAAAPDALAAALAAQRALAAEPWGETGPIRARIALHSGLAQERDDDYFGPTVNRVARLLSTGYGEQILLSGVTWELVRDHLPSGATLRDLGEHRLKDLARPERIYQIVIPDLPADFPPLKTLDHRPNNLPPSLTPFVGRERELVTVRQRLERPEVRLLTLTGPGGTGKTRLGLQVAAELVDVFTDGVFFVALDTVENPDLVVSAIAQTLHLREEGGRPLVEQLTEHLRNARMLLFLDNFEQVSGAAPLVARLLRDCPRLTALISSRARLQLHGEQEFAVPPLGLPPRTPLPPLDQLTEYEAVRLFVERAEAVKPDFALTADNAPAAVEICHRLDGLPLAIELAAARVRLLTPQAMLSRLESRLGLLTGGGLDLPARQQTLRGAIAWSHDLLSEEEQRLFRHLAIFVGGCTLDAAEAVSRGVEESRSRGVRPTLLDSSTPRLLDSMASLTDKSLLRQVDQEDGEPRFVLLQTIREFGLEQLETAGETEALAGAHATYFLGLAEQADPAYFGPEQEGWLDRMEVEHDNLRAALRWGIAAGERASCLRLGAALWQFWWLRGHLSEGRAHLAEILALPGADANDNRAHVLRGSGVLAGSQGDYGRSTAFLEESLAHFRQVEDERGIALTLNDLGAASFLQGEYELAELLHDESLALFRQIGDRRGISLSLLNLGHLAHRARGDAAQATAFLEESLHLARQLGNRLRISQLLNTLGVLALEQPDYPRATRLFEESLALNREAGDKQGIAYSLHNLGEVALAQADDERAAPLFEASLQLAREMDDRRGIAEASSSLATIARRQGDDRRAAALFAEAMERYRDFDDDLGLMTCLQGLAGIAGASGQGVRAARLLGAAAALGETLRASPGGADEVDDQEDVAGGIRAALGDDAFLKAWTAGRALPRDQAIAEALRPT